MKRGGEVRSVAAIESQCMGLQGSRKSAKTREEEDRKHTEVLPRSHRGESVVLFRDGSLIGPSGQEADEVIGVAMVLGLPVGQGPFAPSAPALTLIKKDGH